MVDGCVHACVRVTGGGGGGRRGAAQNTIHVV